MTLQSGMDMTAIQGADEQFVRGSASAPLPRGDDVVREGRALCDQVTLRQSAFLRHAGMNSEYEYKRACVASGRIMYHAHIGMNDWAATAQALRYLEAVAAEHGFTIDRAGVALDRRMGLPAEQRASWPAETGPLLVREQDWRELADCARIQPHMGDFMIGQPAAVENTVHALRAGVTTIGNLSQYFTFEAPGWLDRAKTSIESIKAIGILAGFRDQGVMLHSYLEDGFGALFQDCATVAGWAYLEKYIVEEQLGARLSHCIGGLTSDPVKRAGWVAAFRDIHEEDAAGSMIYGDTISFNADFNHNRGLVSEYLLWDIMAQLRHPTGHAVLPLPVTEAVRIPSAEEIADAHCLGRRVEETARRLLPLVDFSPVDEFAATVCEGGRRVFDNALTGLRDLGVDVEDPLRLLHTLKCIGASRFERLYGVGKADPATPHGRRAVVPTDIFELSLRVIDENRALFQIPGNRARVAGRFLLLASSDVHEHAIHALGQLLSEAGARVVNLGPEQNPGQIAEAALAHGVDGILLSTHNGNALEYAERLQRSLGESGCDTPVIVGGVLNQKVDDNALPVPVSNEIRKLGFGVAGTLEQLTACLPKPAGQRA
ncbi:MAG: cobalamin-dependent protein [Gammaproteobacteria bacterium]|nr:cobalamin-dependent protein [Gammaproteobacteria bacterium]